MSKNRPNSKSIPNMIQLNKPSPKSLMSGLNSVELHPIPNGTSKKKRYNKGKSLGRPQSFEVNEIRCLNNSKSMAQARPKPEKTTINGFLAFINTTITLAAVIHLPSNYCNWRSFGGCWFLIFKDFVGTTLSLSLFLENLCNGRTGNACSWKSSVACISNFFEL